MKIAVSQLIASTMPMLEFADKAKAAGFDGAELLLSAANKGLNYDTTDAELADIRKIFAERSLELFSVSVSGKSGNLLDSGEPAKDAIGQAVFGLETASKVGAKLILHTLGRLSPELYYEDAFNNAIDNLKTIAKSAEKIGIILAVEFVWNGFLFSPLEMRDLLEKVGSDRIGFYFDPGNMAVFQFPQHWVRALGKHTKHVHLKDWKGGALKGEWTALLQGAVDFPTVMRELRAAGYAGPLVSEVSSSLASWEDTAKAMRQIAEM